MPTALAWLRDHASPPIRYRTARDLLGETPDAELRAAVRAWPAAAALAGRQDPDGTWAGRLHTAGGGRPYLCTEACLRRLLDLGWDASDPAVARALQSPHLLGRSLDEPVPLRDSLPPGAGTEIRAALLAEAGRTEPAALRNYAATVADGLVATYLGWAHGHALWEQRGAYCVLSHAVVWPTIYHLRLLASAEPAIRERARPAAELAVAQPPPPGLRFEHDGRLYAPLPAAHTCLFSPDPWVRLEALTLAARAGWVQDQPPLQEAARWFLAQADSDGFVSLPGRYRHFTSACHGALEPDWRQPRRRRADWTFRVALLRAALCSA